MNRDYFRRIEEKQMETSDHEKTQYYWTGVKDSLSIIAIIIMAIVIYKFIF